MEEGIRKGAWREQEDMVLVNFVHLFGDRRWDFIAKISGLKRTGKSCRLRWINYLNPGLKRGKMTSLEERLVQQLHARWGNRWSKIARKLPGRTDNEIKNYWRSHTRKTTQEQRQATSPSSSSSSSASLASSLPEGGYSMDDIWKEIEMSEEDVIKPARDSYARYSCFWGINEDESNMFLPTYPFMFPSEQGGTEQDLQTN